MVDIWAAVGTATRYLVSHPEEVWRALRNTPKLRLSVPIVAVRYLVAHLDLGPNGPRDIVVDGAPPALSVAATVTEMDTPIRARASVAVRAIELSPTALRAEVELRDVQLEVLDDQSRTPLAALIRSKALDVSRVGNLVAHLPSRPLVLEEVREDILVLDFLRHPRVRDDERLRRVLAGVLRLLSLRAIEIDREHVEFVLKALPEGWGGLAALTSQVTKGWSELASGMSRHR